MSTTGHHSSRSIVFAVCQKMDNVLARVLVILLALCLGVTKLRGCEVFVEQPWEEYTYIPEGSVVEVSCSGGIDQSPQWSINLPGASSTSQFGFEVSIMLLNSKGFYQKKSELDNSSSVLLHINNTEEINGTEILCDDLNSATTISRTVLIVYEPTAMEVQVHDSQLQMVIISWTPLQYHWDGNYTLTVTSSNTDTQFYQLQEVSTFTFTSPKDAPPCEVYNFSVTATYVGATYTGAGCSVPSPVLSTMLPSLPDIKKIESSLNYAVALEKHNLEIITMTVSLMPSAHYCEDYPVQNYTLVAENLLVQESFLLANENSSIALPENMFYRFKVVAKNVIGKVSTEYREIFTSDVQTVGAVESTEDKQFQVNCTFMTGSNALGCMVVLVSVYHNATVKLMRQNSSNNVEKSVIVTYPPSCYTKVFGYDIENNGDIGNLAVPGELNKIASNSNSIAECSPEGATADVPKGATAGVPRLLLIITGLGVLIALLIIVIILVLCVCVCRMKKSHRFKTDDLKRSSHPKLSSVSIQPVLSPEKCSKYSETPLPIYDLPTTLARNRMSSEMTESTDYSRTRHFSNKTSHSDVEDIDCQDYAQLQENFYHVLECGGTRYSPELSPADLNNFYDNPEVFTTLKSESTPDSTTQEIPVYQEITAYQQQRQGKSSKT